VDEARVVDHEAVRAWAASLSSETPLPVPVSAPPRGKSKRAPRKR